jgi:hypothetical protein
MTNNRSSLAAGAPSSTALRARLTVGIYIVIAAVIAAACDVHGVSAPGSLASITVTPSATIAASSTEQMTAVGLDADGRVVPISPTWSIAASGGTISASGMFSAGGTAGVFTNTIVATVGTISGRASVTVTPGVLASITILPASASLGIGAAQTFVATGKDAGGNTVVFTPTWSVVAGGGTITQAGVFTAGNTLGVFTNTVQASSGGVTAFATVTVTAGPLASIKVTPVSATLAFNGIQQFTATGSDAAGNPVVITPAWSVVANGGAISATGLFTAGAVAGTFTNTVKATSGTVSGLASVVVVASGGAGVLTTITVLPNPVSMQVSTTQQFTASGKDALGNPFAITPVWSVVNGGGTISASGLFTAGTVAGLFTNTVQATSGTVSGLATVTTTLTGTPPFAGAANLGTAAPNGIMAGTAVTCVTGGIINANVSVSPGNTVTGFGPCVITGVQHLGDAVALQGQIDLTTAYNTLAGLPCPPANAIVGNLGGTTKAAGVYCTASGIGVSGTLTLDGGGDPNATFVFQAGTSLITAGNIVLINSAQAKNVWWQVGSSATLGTASQWQGNILSLTSITLVDNATLLGRALARNGAVTLGTNNTITLP